MPIVSFWGPVHGQVGTTANTIMAASFISIEQNIKTMVTQTHWSHSTLESLFTNIHFHQENNEHFTDSGLDALERLARSNRLTPQSIRDYTVPLLKDRLDLLAGTKKRDIHLYTKINGVINHIFQHANAYYDLITVDVHSGRQNPLTNTLLYHSDLIVVCLNQNIQLLSNFFSREYWHPALDQKPYIIVLGKYDPQLRLSIKNVIRRFRCAKPMYVIPYDSKFRDACNENRVLEYFIRARYADKKQQDYAFIRSVREFTQGVLKYVGFEKYLNSEKGAS